MGKEKTNDSKEERSARQSKKEVRSSKKSASRAWTKEEMREAEPIPLPSPDDDSDKEEGDKQ